ncbi:hypothetical protein EON65_34090 [archaeon]|nr:MAG: hypothetical protein EON65_34090 [archaeon]
MNEFEEQVIGNLQNFENLPDASKGKRGRDEDTSSIDEVQSKLARVASPVHQEAVVTAVHDGSFGEETASHESMPHVKEAASLVTHCQVASSQALEHSPESAFLSSILADVTPLSTPSPAASNHSNDVITPTPTSATNSVPGGSVEIIPATPYLEIYKALRAKFRAARRTSLSSPPDRSPEAASTPIVYSQFVTNTARELGTPEDIVRFALEGMRGIRLIEEEDKIVQSDGFQTTPMVAVTSTVATPPSPIDTRLVQQCIGKEDAQEQQQAADESVDQYDLL